MGTRPFPYPGSKASISQWIVDHMPHHERYVEPFGGAAAVLFTKPRSEVEVYNDLDGSLANFFEVLRDDGDELREWLEQTPFSREQHQDWSQEWYEEEERPDDPIKHAGQFFYLRYTQWNGKHGQAVDMQHRGGKKAHEFEGAVDRLEFFQERMRGVMVEKMDYGDLIDEYNGSDTLFYFDPDLSGWTDDDLFTEECIIPQSEFMEAIEKIKGYWMVSVLEESLPPEWEEDDDTWVFNKKYRSYNEHLVMNFNPRNVPKFEGVGSQEEDALTSW